MSWSKKVYLFGDILRTDLVIFKKHYMRKVINMLIWTGPTALVTSCVFPHLGMGTFFGRFYVVSIIGNINLFDVQSQVSLFISDVEGDRSVFYGLTLPLNAYMWYCARIVSYAIRLSLVAIVALPYLKLLLQDKFSLAELSIFKFLVIFISFNIFFSSCALLIASFIKSMEFISETWVRVLFPLWFFGCSQYPWKTLHSISPTLAYFSLINPAVYGYEGMHVAFLGQTGYLPFWMNVIALWCFTFLFGWWGFIRLKQWLDFV
jgi:ABC-2 type transport system permease protein